MMRRSASRYEMDMTTGPILPNMIRFAIPLMLSSLLQLMYNAADMVVVGRFAGGHALAAVGATSSLIGLIVNVFMGISVGVSVNIARAWGAKNEEDVSRILHTAVLTSVFLGFFVMCIGLLGSRTFLIWMDTPEEVLPLSVLYMRIYFLGIPASMMYNFCAAAIRSTGDTRTPLIFLCIAGVVNVCLNLVLVIVFHLSVAGVAIATATSQVVSVTLVLIYLVRQKSCLKLKFRELRIYPDRLRSILRIGIPSGLQSAIFAISNVLIQSSINSLGTTVMEANTAVGNLEAFLYIAQNAFYHSALTFVGQNIGAKQYKRIKKIVLTCLLLVTIVGVTFGAFMVTFHESLISIYSSAEDASEMIAIGFTRMIVTSSTYFLCGIMEVLTGALRGLGASLTSMLLSVFGVCGIRIAWVSFIFPLYRTVQALYIAYPISWGSTSLMLLIGLIITYRNFMKKHSEETSVTAP